MKGPIGSLGRGLAAGLVIAVLLPSPAPAIASGGFSLTADEGQALSLSDLKGRLVVLAFGYTQCPDICPTTLAELARVLRELGAEAQRVQVLFITLDPKRDTPERLHAYVRHFDPRVIGLTGTVDQVSRVARQFGARFAIHRSDESALSYSVDHSTDLYVIDGQGELAAILPYGTPLPQTLGLLRALLSDL